MTNPVEIKFTETSTDGIADHDGRIAVLVTPGTAPKIGLPKAAREAVARAMASREGAKLNQITRHMLGLFHGRPGARLWRRVLSEGAHKAQSPAEGLALYDAALDQIRDAMAAA